MDRAEAEDGAATVAEDEEEDARATEGRDGANAATDEAPKRAMAAEAA
jgi:hypothetical protein